MISIVRRQYSKTNLSSLFTPEKLGEVLIQVNDQNEEIGPIPILDAHMTNNIFEQNIIHRYRVNQCGG